MSSRPTPRRSRSPRRSRPNSPSAPPSATASRILPAEELDRFSKSGLWGITVPKAYGGAQVSFATLAEVIKLISAADPSIGQIPQNHLAALDAIRFSGSEAQKAHWFGLVLRGFRLGNAFSEAKSKHVGAFETTIVARRRRAMS